MTDTHYSDAGRPGTTSEASSDTIEMENLDGHSFEHTHHKSGDLDKEYREPEEVSDDEAEDDTALLVYRGEQPSGEEHPNPKTGTETHAWRQALRILIEVRFHILLITFTLD